MQYFQVGHYSAGRGCHYGNGNPNDDRFQNWLGIISNWSLNRRGVHAPITIFIELKSYTHSTAKVLAIENAIKQSINPNILFKASEINKKCNVQGCKPWPSIQELWGKIIVVITSFWGFGSGYGLPGTGYSNYEGWESRWHFHINLSCESAFVAWTDEDQDRKRRQNENDTRAQILQNESRFLICNNDKNLGTIYFNNEPEKLVRSDFGGTSPHGYLINFPISDSWSTALTSRMYKWAI